MKIPGNLCKLVRGNMVEESWNFMLQFLSSYHIHVCVL